MLKAAPLIPTEIVLAQLETISARIQIIPELASVWLGFSTKQLEDRRDRTSMSALIYKIGWEIRYQLGARLESWC